MSDELNQLSEREREILKLVATGATNQQIAIDLGISINTVKVHLRNIFGKIGAASRTEATMLAVRAGLVTLGSTNGSLSPAAEPPSLTYMPPLPSAEEPASTADPSANVSPIPIPETVVAPATLNSQPKPSQNPWMTVVGILGGMLIALLLLWLLGLRPPAANPQPPERPTASGAVISPTSIDAVWTLHSNVPATLTAAAATSLEGLVYVIGGRNASGASAKCWSYDPDTSVWTPIADKLTAVNNAQAVILAGKIWVPGGDSNATITNKLEVYDPKTKAWTEQASMPEARSGYGIAAIDGRMYVFGGWDGSQVRSETFVYDPATNTWSQDKPMPTARAYMATATVDGKVYVLGGESSSGALAINEVYTPVLRSQGNWTTSEPMPVARSHFTSVASDSNVIVLGGSQSELPARFNVRTMTWASLKDSPQPLGPQPAATIRDSRIFVVSSESSKTASQFYEMRLLYNVYLPLP